MRFIPYNKPLLLAKNTPYRLPFNELRLRDHLLRILTRMS